MSVCASIQYTGGTVLTGLGGKDWPCRFWICNFKGTGLKVGIWEKNNNEIEIKVCGCVYTGKTHWYYTEHLNMV